MSSPRKAPKERTTSSESLEEWDGPRWRRNFFKMCVLFSLCQATVTTPISFATSLLDPTCGAIGTGLLDLVACASALVFGPPTVAALGPKKGLVFAETFSGAYAVLFALSTVAETGSTAQWWLYLLGATAAGLGAGMLWTAQGEFFTRSVAIVSRLEAVPSEDVSAEMGGTFAMVLLLSDFGMKTMASLLRGKFLNWTVSEPLMSLGDMFFLFAAVAITMTFFMATAVSTPFAPAGTAGAEVSRREKFLGKLQAAVSMWWPPIVWCLGVMNILFGFCAGYMNGEVNRAFESKNPDYGTGALGSLVAGTCLVAALTAHVFSWISKRTGKGFVMGVAALAFFAIPASILTAPPTAENEYWGNNLVILYVLQGIGRGVYESTNKGVFCDFFPGKQSAGAFANVRLQNSFGFFVSFTLQGVLEDKTVLGYIVLVLAALVMPCFALAWVLRRRAERAAIGTGQEPLAPNAA